MRQFIGVLGCLLSIVLGAIIVVAVFSFLGLELHNLGVL